MSKATTEMQRRPDVTVRAFDDILLGFWRFEISAVIVEVRRFILRRFLKVR